MGAKLISIHRQCGAAARKLLENPDLRMITQGPPGVFTELDVIFLAAREAGGYNELQMREVAREASQVLGTGGLYGKGLAVRFGPVEVPGVDAPDYARHNTKIIYAAPDGPSKIKTPNGTFSRILRDNDPIPAQAGRKHGAARDDLVDWEGQDILGLEPKPSTVEQREILRLRAENAALRDRVQELEQEIQQVRDHIISQVTREEVEELRQEIAGLRPSS